MQPCPCTEIHHPKRIVLTGGPGAGKTAVLELARHAFCQHVAILPESAGIVFGGGFPRGPVGSLRRGAQRAIFYVQRELERAQDDVNPALVLCDRGTVDGAAYWPGPDELWTSVGSALEEQLARYDAVIHLRVPPAENGYNRSNPLRIETAQEAAAIDQRIAWAWATHPRRFEVAPTPEFLTKASQVVELIRQHVPPCCLAHTLTVEAAEPPGSAAAAPATR